jgi:hypothetical protein
MQMTDIEIVMDTTKSYLDGIIDSIVYSFYKGGIYYER